MPLGIELRQRLSEAAGKNFITGQPLIDQFHAMLISAGLTDDEAAGLVDCWARQSFQTPARGA
jgi:hypothetical protein